MARIGFIGVGRMGQLMCANFVGAGYQVAAGDVRAELESMVTGYGARWEGRPAALVAEPDVLITMLPGPGEVHGVIAGPCGGELLADLLPCPATANRSCPSPRISARQSPAIARFEHGA